MRILFVYSHSVTPGTYVFQALDSIPKSEMTIDRVYINDYVTLDDTGYDGLIYNTFAYEGNPIKFDRNLINATDEKYHRFKGQKLLFDTYDDGNKDGFGRFNDHDTPRMKITPGYEFMESFKVINALPFKVRRGFWLNGDVKTIPVIYCVSTKGYPHNIRTEVLRKLEPFQPFTEKLHITEYAVKLRQSKVAVTAPGWGPGTKSQVEALAAGCVLLAHESMKTVKILPYYEMIGGINCVYFNLDNLEEKLSALLGNEDAIRHIGESGWLSFSKGYTPQRTGKEIIEYFNPS